MAGGKSTVKIPSMVLPDRGSCATPGLISMSMVVCFACAQQASFRGVRPAGSSSVLPCWRGISAVAEA